MGACLFGRVQVLELVEGVHGHVGVDDHLVGAQAAALPVEEVCDQRGGGDLRDDLEQDGEPEQHDDHGEAGVDEVVGDEAACVDSWLRVDDANREHQYDVG